MKIYDIQNILMSTNNAVPTIIDVLNVRQEVHPEKDAFIYLKYENEKRTELYLSYRELVSEAKRMAGYFQSINACGERAMLLYPPGLEFIKAFFACLYAGVVAVPSYHNISRKRLEKTNQLIEDSGAKYILCPLEIKERLSKIFNDDINLISTDEISAPDVSTFPITEKIAYLQYTSGSISKPKGVIISHENIMHNEGALYKTFGYTSESVGVGWLPHHHDMGLVLTIMMAVYSGGTQVLMSPFDFISKPYRWLEAFSDFGGTHGGAPNFAYERLANTVTDVEKSNLDLSKIQVLWNGAEPIRYKVFIDFYEKFASTGLKKEALYPAYGMAEATLLISGEKNSSSIFNFVQIDSKILEQENRIEFSTNNKRSQILVSNGKAFEEECQIKIVNPKTFEECQFLNVGEIWINSRSVALGYWGKEKETNASFKAQIKGRDLLQYFRTGDLGFIYNNEVYITGRYKDLIILHGVNYIPSDIEYSIEKECSLIRPNCSAAFSINVENDEKLAIAVELKRGSTQFLDIKALAANMRTIVTENHELQLHTIYFLQQGKIPKTTSGKIQRQLCKDMLLTESLESLYIDSIGCNEKNKNKKASSSKENNIEDIEIRDVIIPKISELLNVSKDAINTAPNLISLGFDSLSITVLKQFIETHFYTKIEFSLLFDNSFSTDKLIAYIVQNKNKKASKNESRNIQTESYSTFPLTDLQYAYWIGRNNTFALGGSSARAYLEIEMSIPLDVEAFSDALYQTILRHDLLHSVVNSEGCFETKDQIDKLKIKIHDFSNIIDVAEQKSALKEIREKMRQEVIPLSQYPLLNFQISKLKRNKNILHLNIDLLIADIKSIKILLNDLHDFYTGIAKEPLSISFKQFALTQNSLKQTEEYMISKKYWQSKIDNIFPAPQLPLRKQPNELKSIRFSHLEKSIISSSKKQLERICRENGITPSTLFLTAYSIVLSSWSKSTKFTLNITLFNRTSIHPQINELVGDFTTTTLLAIDAIQNDFFELAREIQQALAKNLEHKEYSGIDILRDLARRENVSNVYMPVVFTGAISRTETDSYKFGKRIYSVSHTPQVWLDHQIFNENDSYVLVWDYIEELFPFELITTMFSEYSNLIDRIIREDLRNSSHILPEEQLKKRLEYNNSQITITPRLLYEDFLKFEAKMPNKIAIYDNGREISYLQLKEAAYKIAIKVGEKKQASPFVAIYADKGWEQIAAALGIQMAGYAYVHINPELPLERQKILLSEAGIEQIVTTKLQEKSIRLLGIQKWITIDECFLNYENNIDFECKKIETSSIAYLIYTSGSTGKPKGVYVSHESAYNTIKDVNQKFNVSENDCCLALSSLSFDLSVYDIFGLLGVGGQIVIPDKRLNKDPEHYYSLIERYGITLWNSVPSFMDLLMEYIESKGLKLDLRLVMLSGDWIPINLIRKIKGNNANCETISLGGATEAAIWSIYYPIKEINPKWKSIPYGKPLSNQKIYILNERLEHCPDYVVGEIYIGGFGLAQGYWNDSEKTNNSFITWSQTGERIYKTGDMGCYLPDDDIVEFLGREDGQVKIGGHRIEIGEIETVLNSNPAIKRGIVSKIKNNTGNDYLGAFIILQNANNEKQEKIAEPYNENISIILDRNERTIFRLQQHSIRKNNVGTETLQIPQDKSIDVDLAYIKRGTSRQFLDSQISFFKISKLLNVFDIRTFNGVDKRRYASAGGLYPVQVYLYVNSTNIEGLDKGSTYYYNPKENALIEISQKNNLDTEIHVDANKNIAKTAAFTIFFIGDILSIAPLYGKKSYDFCMLEAGLMTQLLENEATKQGIGLCQIGDLYNHQYVKDVFQLKDTDILLHTILGGQVNFDNSDRVKPLETTFSTQNLIEILKTDCAKKLPNYMLPSTWHIIDDIPLTPTGKTNYKKLVEIHTLEINKKANTLQDDNSNISLTNKSKYVITKIVKDTLNLASIDDNRNFFELGADSHSLVRIWSEITKVLRVDFPVVKMFEYPTINKLLSFLDMKKIADTNVNISRGTLRRNSLKRNNNKKS